MLVRSSLCLIPLCLATALGCAHSPSSLALTLTWSPSSDPGDVPSTSMEAFVGQTLQILPFTDARTVKEIGANHEESAPRPVITPDDVAAYLTSRAAIVLQASHVNVVPAGGTRLLQGAVNQFFVKEDNTYNGTVVMTFTLTNAQGKTLWQGVATGHSKRFGHSFDPGNYNECLSEATIEVFHDLLKNPDFLAAAHGR
ncbi:MAG: SH2 domain-containing protein [Myxococcales bacterium]